MNRLKYATFIHKESQEAGVTRGPWPMRMSDCRMSACTPMPGRRKVGHMASRQKRRSPEHVTVSSVMGMGTRILISAELIDLSPTGVRIQHCGLLRPGVACSLELLHSGDSIVLPVEVIRSAVIALSSPARGGCPRYGSELTFIQLTPEQRMALETFLAWDDGAGEESASRSTGRQAPVRRRGDVRSGQP